MEEPLPLTSPLPPPPPPPPPSCSDEQFLYYWNHENLASIVEFICEAIGWRKYNWWNTQTQIHTYTYIQKHTHLLSSCGNRCTPRTNTDTLSHTIKHTRTQNTNRVGAHSPIRTCSKRIIVVLAIICPKYKLTRVFSQTNNASFICGFVQFYSLNCFTLSVRYPFNKFCLHVQFLL